MNVAPDRLSPKTFLTTTPDEGGERRWHGYPDECYSLTTFADSLVALAYEGEWIVQPPIVDLRNAIVVDFVSETQAQAEASIPHGWNGAWELPMGAVSTVYGRTETNEQNARIERHLLYIGTAMTMGDFHRRVGEKLLDVHTCRDPKCDVCVTRFPRGLAESLQILADGTNQRVVHLFSKWQPDRALSKRLASDRVKIRWHHLDEINPPDLEANRFYSIWDGSVAQAAEFLASVWAPAWKRESPASARELAKATPRAKKRKARGAHVCPQCGAKDAIPISYGFPTEEVCAASERGEVALGGCGIDPDNPAFECRQCQHRF